ncbi:MAG: 3-ketoacyl-ACP reductase [Fibrobacteres bacterium]|nr:3-ketoacyl-ACP reductase [Fibrobacterota bacterium]
MKKAALVTGAARGIGRSIAVALSKAGFDIAVADVLPQEDAQEGLDQCAANGSKILYIRSDISSPDGRKQILDSLKNGFGRLDLLVNNAGVAPKVRADILEASEESFDRLMSINLKGPYFLTQLLANWMVEQSKKGEGYEGRIVNIASMSSYTSSVGRGEYCISKAGVSMMTMLYADRLAEFGIGVYEVRPGIIKTDMTAGVKEKYDKLIGDGLLPIKRWGLPEDIAKAVIAVANGYLPYSTGEVINVDGGFHFRRL